MPPNLSTKPLPPLSKDGSTHVTDEFYNTLISSLGAVLILGGTAYLLYRSMQLHSSRHAIGAAVYGVGALSVFVSSALHHGVDGSPRTNFLLRQVDYLAIFLMISGTFTPFCLLVLPADAGRQTLWLVWILATLGIATKALCPPLPKWVTLAMTLGMGWLGLLLVQPVYQAMAWPGLAGLALGGACFTIGGAIFGLERPNPRPGRFGFHEIWHCLVVSGAMCHFASISMLY